MRRLLVPLAGLVLASPLVAQQSDALARIKQEGMERSRVLEVYGALTDAIGPRLTGSPAYHEAVYWLGERLEGMGVRTEVDDFDFGRGWTLEAFTLEMTAPYYDPLTAHPEAWSPSTRGVLEGTPVYVGDRSAAEIRAMAGRLRGAIVLPFPPQPGFITEDRPQPTEHDEPVDIGAPGFIRPEGSVPRNEIADLMREVGAGAWLRPDQGAHGTLFVLGSRNTADDAAPSVVLAGEEYNRLVRMLAMGVAPTLRLELRTRYHTDDTRAYNILAEIPGTDPALSDEVVMAGAHLDSWHSSVGATDNADGVAAVMEALRILQATGVRPRRTVRIALWSGEEQGLLGSRAWVEEHLRGAENREALENLVFYVNQDIGAGATYGLYLQGNEAAAPVLDGWTRNLQDVGARRNVAERIGSSDHVPFDEIGVPSFSTVQDYRDYDVRTHHTNADAYERVKEEDLRQSAVVLAGLLYQAAMADRPLPRKRPASQEGPR
jgi:hypothetical protein